MTTYTPMYCGTCRSGLILSDMTHELAARLGRWYCPQHSGWVPYDQSPLTSETPFSDNPIAVLIAVKMLRSAHYGVERTIDLFQEESDE